MPSRSSKRDFSQVAHSIVERVTGQQELAAPSPEVSAVLDDEEKRKEVMREMGRLGGQKGGAARAQSLSPERRSEIAKVAALNRWKNLK